MKVVFLAPNYPPEMQQYTRGLAEVGATVYGVGDAPVGSLPGSLKQHLSDYLQVPRILDEDDVVARVHAWLRGREVDRVLANWEVLVLTAAKLRERFGLPGMSVDTVEGFRDKKLMKERVAAAGTAHAAGRARAHRERGPRRGGAHRLPLICLKPIAGAGSADTYRLDGPDDLERVLPKMRHVPEASCEEFIVAEEFTFDTVCIEGKAAYTNITQYLPPPLIARSEQWVSPVIITVKDMTQPKLSAASSSDTAC
jgi:biotin carboxylase